MDSLGQTFIQVDSIERHMTYLRCLQHIEELRYCTRARRRKQMNFETVMIEMFEPVLLCYFLLRPLRKNILRHANSPP